MVRVDCNVGITEEDLEPASSFNRIVCSNGERVCWQQCRGSEFFLQPLEERRSNLSTPGAADRELGFAITVPLSDLGLDLVELADVVERTSSKLRLYIFRLDKTALRVRPAQRMLDLFSSLRISGSSPDSRMARHATQLSPQA